MDVSVFLAEFWGWYFIIFFTILSLNPSRIRQMISDLSDEKFLILGSFMAVIMGLVNVLLHNEWEFSWKVIITIIGWMALFKGICLFSFPKQTITWIAKVNTRFIQVLYVLLFLVGLYLLNIVYNWVPYQM